MINFILKKIYKIINYSVSIISKVSIIVVFLMVKVKDLSKKYLTLFFHHETPESTGNKAVSYTHLDVYKRQNLTNNTYAVIYYFINFF